MGLKKMYRSELINYLINSKLFKITIGILIFISFYELIYSNTNYGYIEAIIELMTMSNFMFFISLLICIATIFIYSKYNSNIFYIMRLGNEKKYMKDLLSNVFTINSYIFIGALTFVFVLIIIKSSFFIGLGESIYSYIPNWMYLLFVVLKIYFITICFSLLFTIIMIYINKYLGIASFCLYVLQFYIFSYSSKTITSIFEMKLLPIHYVIPLNYSSFYLELICCCMYITIIIGVSSFICSFFLKINKRIDLEV